MADKEAYVVVENCNIEDIADIGKHNLLELQESPKRYNMYQTYREKTWHNDRWWDNTPVTQFTTKGAQTQGATQPRNREETER